MTPKKKNKKYVRVSRIKDTSSFINWNGPSLDLNTLVELSKKGLLKENKSSRRKAA